MSMNSLSEKSISIRNMVCHRCIMTVEGILNKLNIPFEEVSMGQVVLTGELEKEEKSALQKEFRNVGFEIIQDRNEKLINKIKALIIEKIYSDEVSIEKLSGFLASELHYDYSHITNIFTEYEGQSIQKYYNAVRIERIKELLTYDDWSITMIADKLGYSTPAYLSTSFKQVTGLTPSEYRKQQTTDRNSLDSI